MCNILSTCVADRIVSLPFLLYYVTSAKSFGDESAKKKSVENWPSERRESAVLAVEVSIVAADLHVKCNHVNRRKRFGRANVAHTRRKMKGKGTGGIGAESGGKGLRGFPVASCEVSISML